MEKYKREGKGIKYYNDGSEYNGEWKDGKRVSNCYLF